MHGGGEDDYEDGDAFAMQMARSSGAAAAAASARPGRRRGPVATGKAGSGRKRAAWASAYDDNDDDGGAGGGGGAGAGAGSRAPGKLGFSKLSAFEEEDEEEEEAEEEGGGSTAKRVRYRVTTRQLQLRDTGAAEETGARVIEPEELRSRFMRARAGACTLCWENFMMDGGEEETELELKLRSTVEELLAWGQDLGFVYLYVSRFREQKMPTHTQWSVEEVQHHLSQCIRVIDVMVENDIQDVSAAAHSALACTFRGDWETRTMSHQNLGGYVNLLKMKYGLLKMDRSTLRARVRGGGGAAHKT